MHYVEQIEGALYAGEARLCRHFTTLSFGRIDDAIDLTGQNRKGSKAAHIFALAIHTWSILCRRLLHDPRAGLLRGL